MTSIARVCRSRGPRKCNASLFWVLYSAQRAGRVLLPEAREARRLRPRALPGAASQGCRSTGPCSLACGSVCSIVRCGNVPYRCAGDSAEDTGQRFRSGALGAAAQRLRLHAVIDVELEARLAAPVAKGLFLGQKYPLNRSNRTEPLTAGSPPRTKAQQRSTEKADFRAE